MSIANYYMSGAGTPVTPQAGELAVHPETGEVGRFKYIHGIGYINQDTWNPTSVDENGLRNDPDWMAGTDALMRTANVAMGLEEDNELFRSFFQSMSEEDRAKMQGGLMAGAGASPAQAPVPEPANPYENPLTAGMNRGTMGTGGGFLGAYNAKRQELDNKTSVMSLFKEMENYEQSPQ